MTTRAVMKERISQEIRRKALNDVGARFQDAIGEAITTAIAAYQDRRFFFNESRDLTFNTVADQEFYDSDDAAQLANLVKIDYVKLRDGNTVSDLLPDFPSEMESASTNATATGQPGWFLWYNQQIRLYPIPDDVYGIRVAGVFSYAEPAADATTGNFWMTRGERLIRSRAKYELALHVLRDTELAQTMASSVTEALNQLQAFTNKLTQRDNGRVRAMDF